MEYMVEVFFEAKDESEAAEIRKYIPAMLWDGGKVKVVTVTIPETVKEF